MTSCSHTRLGFPTLVAITRRGGESRAWDMGARKRDVASSVRRLQGIDTNGSIGMGRVEAHRPR
jgi:hypothetical protein